MKGLQERLREGHVVNGRYQIEAFWERHDTGSSYWCRDLDAGKSRVRLKLVGSDDSCLCSSVGLGRELSFLRMLRHPNLIRILDFGVLEGSNQLFLVEEWVDGEDLYSATERMDSEAVLRWILEVSKALHYLHGRGIVHGNLSCANTILGKSGNLRDLKLLGFGSINRLTSHLRKGAFKSLAYMAPEALMEGVVNENSDLYSLGVMIYQLLTRRLPFEDEDPGFLIQKHLQGAVDLRPIERLQCGAGSAALISRLLDKDPSKRPSSEEVVLRIAGELPAEKLKRNEASELEVCLSASPLVGRDREMSLLRNCAQQVSSNGRGWTVFVTGDAGCGKTRCMEELKSWALLEGWRVIEGACGTHEEGAYGPFRQILSKTDPLDCEPIFQFKDIPRVEESGAFEASSEFAAGQFRDLLTRELVRRLADRATLLLLHNFHLSDEATNTVLDYLSSDVQSHPVLICVSLRSGEEAKGMLGRVMEMVVRQERGQILNLLPWTKEDVEQFVGGVTGDAHLSQPLGTWLFERIGGNPYFLEEMLKHLVEQGLLRPALSQWRFVMRDLAQLEVPASVSGVLRRRLEQLPAPAREIANWLAVFRRAVCTSLLSRVTGWEAARIADALEELKNRQMVRINARNPEEDVEFCHSLIAEVIRADLPKRVRRRIHLRIAEFLEREFGTESHLQEIATHYMEGRAHSTAVRNVLKLASESRAEFAHDIAIQCFEYVFKNRKNFEEDELCISAIQASDSMFALGLPQKATRLLKREMKRCGNVNANLKARMFMQLALCYQHLGNQNLQQLYCRTGLKLLRNRNSKQVSSTRAMLWAQLAFGSILKSQPKA